MRHKFDLLQFIKLVQNEMITNLASKEVIKFYRGRSGLTPGHPVNFITATKTKKNYKTFKKASATKV